MQELLDGFRWIHVAAGFTGLAAFWVPVFTRKGGRTHRMYGKVFKYCAYLVLGAAGAAILLRFSFAMMAGEGPSTAPQGFAFLVFLGYLTLVTFVVLRHGVGVLENKDLTSMDTTRNRILARTAIGASIALVAYALYFNPPIRILLYAMSPIGILSGLGILKAIGGKRTENKAWFYEHMGAMIGAGIAFHTAFAVFGSTRLFEIGLTGLTAVIPWILPALIGIPATAIWTRYYQRKFGDLAA